MSIISSVLYPKVIDDTSHGTDKALSAAEVDYRIGDVVYNVVKYGADPTGTTDATQYIQAAVDAAIAAGGGTVYFPDGTYKIGHSGTSVTSVHSTDLTYMGIIIADCENIHIRGAGRERVKFIQAGNASNVANTAFIALVAPVSNIEISGMEIDGGFTGSENGGVGIWGDTTITDGVHKNISIHDTYIHSTRGYGMGLQYGRYHGIEIYRNELKDTGADGIDFKNRETTQDNYGIHVHGNLFDNPGTRDEESAFAGQVGVDIRGQAVVENNNFINIGCTGTYGDRVAIRFRQTSVAVTGIGGTYSVVRDNRIRSKSGAETAAAGLYVAAAFVRAEANDIQDCKAAGGAILYVTSATDDATDGVIAFNNIKNFGSVATSYGIKSTSARTKIIGNSLDTGETGIRYSAASTINMGNTILNTTNPYSIAPGANGSNRIGNITGSLGGANIFDNGTGSVLVIGTNTTETNKTIRLIPTGSGDVQLGSGAFSVPHTNTAAGTTGNQTINKAAGRVNIAAGGTSITVTNSLVSTTSHVFASVGSNDMTAQIKNIVLASGSFTINMVAAVTAETPIDFIVFHGY